MSEDGVKMASQAERDAYVRNLVETTRHIDEEGRVYWPQQPPELDDDPRDEDE